LKKPQKTHHAGYRVSVRLIVRRQGVYSEEQGEPVANGYRLKDPLAAILKELRIIEKEKAANKAEVDQKLVDLMQEIRASTESDSASTAWPHVTEAQQSILQPTEGTISDAAVAQPVAKCYKGWVPGL
jgi:hypothetical protein